MSKTVDVAEGLDPVEVALTILRLGNKARRAGLLSLEDELPGLPSAFLRAGFMEVVDGTPPAEIRDVLEARIEELGERLARQRQDQLTLARLMLEGVMGVQRGHAPMLLLTLLEGRLSPEQRQRLRQAWDAERPRGGEHPRPPKPETAGILLGEVQSFFDLHKLNSASVIRVLREMETKNLALALKGAPPEVWQNIRTGLSRRAAEEVEDQIEIMGPQRESAIQDAREQIMAIVRRLAERERQG